MHLVAFAPSPSPCPEDAPEGALAEALPASSASLTHSHIISARMATLVRTPRTLMTAICLNSVMRHRGKTRTAVMQ